MHLPRLSHLPLPRDSLSASSSSSQRRITSSLFLPKCFPGGSPLGPTFRSLFSRHFPWPLLRGSSPHNDPCPQYLEGLFRALPTERAPASAPYPVCACARDASAAVPSTSFPLSSSLRWPVAPPRLLITADLVLRYKCPNGHLDVYIEVQSPTRARTLYLYSTTRLTGRYAAWLARP